MAEQSNSNKTSGTTTINRVRKPWSPWTSRTFPGVILITEAASFVGNTCSDNPQTVVTGAERQTGNSNELLEVGPGTYLKFLRLTTSRRTVRRPPFAETHAPGTPFPKSTEIFPPTPSLPANIHTPYVSRTTNIWHIHIPLLLASASNRLRNDTPLDRRGVTAEDREL